MRTNELLTIGSTVNVILQPQAEGRRDNFLSVTLLTQDTLGVSVKPPAPASSPTFIPFTNIAAIEVVRRAGGAW